MDNSAFRVIEHVLPCYRTLSSVDSKANPVSLSVKQYVPVEDPSTGHDSITVIAAHANGYAKELLKGLHRRQLGIRSIWIADVAHQGTSGVLNRENHLLRNVRWNDHVRDMIRMIDHFHEWMVKPVVAVGHSMGGSQVLSLAAACPDIFSSLILLDPAIGPVWAAEGSLQLARLTLKRKVEWLSRHQAKEAFQRSFRTWDAAVLGRYEEYALAEETSAGRDVESAKTKLVNCRYQELIGFIQQKFLEDGNVTSPEMKYQHGPISGYNALESIESSVLFLCGSNSPATPDRLRKTWSEKIAANNNNIRIVERFIPNTGHYLPFEAPQECGEAIADWIAEEMEGWVIRHKNERSIEKMEKSERECLSNKWMDKVKEKLS